MENFVEGYYTGCLAVIAFATLLYLLTMGFSIGMIMWLLAHGLKRP